MKELIILRGLPGSGKSTWIRKHNFERFTLSLDTIRLMFCQPNPMISQSYNDEALYMFKTLFTKRIGNGSFTIIDNTNIVFEHVKEYIEIAKANGYTIKIIDFTNINIKECYKRNKEREPYKHVSIDVFDKMVSQLKNETIKFKMYQNIVIETFK